MIRGQTRRSISLLWNVEAEPTGFASQGLRPGLALSC